MSTADYQGRRFDVLALQGAVPVGEVRLEQQLFSPGNSGQVCVGIQKLAQRWVLEFFTEVGSMLYLPTRGCTFMEEVRNGLLQTEANVETSFKFSNIDVQRNLINEEDSTWPDDERFFSAELLSLTVTAGTMILHVAITSLAQTTRKVILPISVVPS